MTYGVFSLEQLAEYLHLSIADVEQLVRHQEIPFTTQGGRPVFLRGEIDAWASQRILGLSGEELVDYHKTSSAKTHDLSAGHALIPELMRPACIAPALAAKTKNAVIRAMVKLAEQTELLNYPADLLEGICEREQMCSTALAGGIALLHTNRHEPYLFEDTFIVLGRTPQPVPFGSPDGRTTDLFFLLCTQDDRMHLHLLARLCMLCYQTSVLVNLRDAPDADGMFARLVEAEKDLLRSL